MNLKQQLETVKIHVASLYKDEKGNPLYLSDAQAYLFYCVYAKKYPRIHCMCFTRFGKSLTTGLAVLTRISTFPEKWAIIAGTKEKAKIIMEYVIAHIFDNDYIKSRFIPEKNESIEDIRRYRNKSHLTFVVNPKDPADKQLLSTLFIGSAKDALGLGAPNIIEDESALIPDNDHSLVMRMLGDNPTENFLLKIGNPFERNHFLNSYHDAEYTKIVIDCYKGLSEDRITQKIIDENKVYAFFKVLYECKFPSANEVDEQGWMRLLLEEDIKIAQTRVVEPMGIRRLGVDVARGGRNFNAFVLRGDNYAKLLEKNNEGNSVKIADKVEEFMKLYNIPAQAVFIDDTGVGHGVVSILHNRGLKVVAVLNGERAKKPDVYTNVRAESYAGEQGLSVWIRGGARLEPHPDWIELTNIFYKKDIGGRTKIQPKEEMLKKGIQSPDVADALALTFAKLKISAYTNPNPINKIGETAIRPFGGVAPLIPGIG